MKSTTYIYLNIFFNIFKMYACQYTLTRPPKSNACENPRSTAPVEQFFNIIFTEFQNPPPVCVCVQMCIEQAAYCYPNGCLKRLDKRADGSTTKPVNRIQYGTTQSLMFVVDKDPDFDSIFEVTSLKSNSDKDKINKINEIVFDSNPFNELVLKYKRLPKMEMKYNLRERVKNSKTAKVKRDKLDMMKTKWPLNRHFGTKQLFNNVYQKTDQIKKPNLLIESATNLPIPYKRLKTKREDTPPNMEELYLYQSDNTSFALETLIDTLILRSLYKNKESENITSKSIDDTLLETIQEVKSNQNHTTNTVEIQDEITNIDNRLNEANQNDYGALITTLSKEIDKQNDKSFKIAKIKIRNQDFVMNAKIEETTECCATLLNDHLVSTNANGIKSDLDHEIYLHSTKNFYPVVRNTLKNRIKKRIVRKLL